MQHLALPVGGAHKEFYIKWTQLDGIVTEPTEINLLA